MKHPGSPSATTEKVDQRIYKLTGSDNIATTDDIKNVLKRHKTSELVKRQFDEDRKKLEPSSAYQHQNYF